MLHTVFLLCFTLMWARIQPELFYGIIQGCTGEDWQNVKSFTLRQTVLYFGLESSVLFILLHFLKGLLFVIILERYLAADAWQQWLCLSILIAGTGAAACPPVHSFWKRWCTYLGGTVFLNPELAQLSLALFVAAALLSRHKKHILWSSTAAALGITLLESLPPATALLVLLAGWLTSAGGSLHRLRGIVNTAKRAGASPKHSFD